MVRKRNHHAIEMAWIKFNLFVKAFSVTHLDGPSFIKLRNQVLALEMVYTESFPALVKFISEAGCLLTLDFSSSFEISPDKFLIHYSFRWIAHFVLLINYIIIE